MEYYLHNLPSDTERIDISHMGLTIFPTELLSRFKQLKILNCSHNKLTFLPSLLNHPFLEILNCSYNKLTFLPSLLNHPFFEILNCSYNELILLPPLNTSLRVLYCFNNQLTSLPPLVNTSLKKLECEKNKLTSLPPLNQSLNFLECENNQLTSLPPLPPSLRILSCSNNQLTSLSSLNASLEFLNCSHNQLTFLPQMNESLYTLCCSNNKLTYIPNLNESLQCILWYDTPIYAILSGNIKNIVKWNRFREYYFLSRLKKKFISWMWKAREEKIKEQFHYKHLLRFMEENGDLENVDLEPFLENFLPVN